MSSRNRLTPISKIARRVLSSSQKLRELASTLQLSRAIRVMAPTLVALSLTGVAHAQGTMDFSGATTLMGTFKTFAIYAGAAELECGGKFPQLL